MSAHLKFMPTAVSCLGALLCVVAGILAGWGGSLLIVLILFAVGSACDAVDGRIARLFSSDSRYGAWIDMLCDKIGEVALLIGLAFRTSDPPTVRLLFVTAVLGLLASYSKATAVETQALSNWPEVRVFGRTARVIAYMICVGCLLVTDEKLEFTRSAVFVLVLLNALGFGWRIMRVSTARRP